MVYEPRSYHMLHARYIGQVKTHLHEQPNDLPTNYVLRISPQAQDIVSPQTLRQVHSEFGFLAFGRDGGGFVFVLIFSWTG
jgi:hypothetical protein